MFKPSYPYKIELLSLWIINPYKLTICFSIKKKANSQYNSRLELPVSKPGTYSKFNLIPLFI